MIKILAEALIVVILATYIAVVAYRMSQDTKVRVDCTTAEFNPDIPTQQKQQCRDLK
jgi:hypothetical protein